ncbi:hypothetical protein AYI70_g11557 [Smittium culicis]|uniref:Hexosyltransferase n=1 Tax=Smittium culicis TaxID=133412 RepID=A0A1R1X1D0_9FUNG|nr:hypothetical protein AYI70_g11557 [Smittium culicis]
MAVSLILIIVLYKSSTSTSTSTQSLATKKSNGRDASGKIINPVNKVSWHLPLDQFNAIKIYDEGKKSYYTSLPKQYYGPANLADLGQDYLIMVPISKIESITFLRNFYSDLNLLVMCDSDDTRPGCDHHLPGKYEYGTLNMKTFDLIQYACKNFPGYKMYAKMDFDAYLNKDYLHGVIKFISDNNDKRIYYGNSFMSKEYHVVFMGGNFYAVSGLLMQDLCTCGIPLPDMYLEDHWFGVVVANCTTRFKDDKHEVHYMYNNGDMIRHKEYKDDGVLVKLGRHVKHE